MKEAIESFRGVHGISMKLCSTPNVPSNESFKWEKVRFLSNLYYVQEGIGIRTSIAIGPGRVFPGLSSMSLKNRNADNGDQTLYQRDYHKLCSSKTQMNRWPNPCN